MSRDKLFETANDASADLPRAQPDRSLAANDPETGGSARENHGSRETERAGDDLADDDLTDLDLEDLGLADLELPGDDRRAMMAPRVSLARRAMGLLPFVLVALAVHVGVLAGIAYLARSSTPIPDQQETAVEVVTESEAPKPPEPEKKALETAKAAQPPDQTKAEPPKEEAKPEPSKPPEPKAEQAKTEQAKTEQTKAEQAKTEEPKPKPETAKEPPRGDPKKEAEATKAVKALQAELQTLNDQKAALQREAADTAADKAAAEAKADKAAAEAQTAKTDADTKALGVLPDSFRAVAMPGESASGDVAVTYQELVFSLLAKARKTGKQVVRPGVAGITFTIADDGELKNVTLQHPSGDKVLDDEAVAIVRRAGPFPKPLPGAQTTFSAAMRFYVDDDQP